jgi:glutathione S-transferase
MKKQKKPIELYYWPTPNGWKISIMLEECKIPYILKPVNIGKGDQFKPKFLKISPNNRMPAIIDPEGPGGKPISVFESGAILQYLGRKSGKFYPKNERDRVKVDEWIYWQMCGLGPMAGQAHHFRQYAPKKINYAVKRYTDEVNRLYGVMDKQLKKYDYLAGRYSIADMACWGWIKPWKNQGQKISDFPYLEKWLEKIGNRRAVKKGFALGKELRKQSLADNTKEAKKAKSILFNQRAR